MPSCVETLLQHIRMFGYEVNPNFNDEPEDMDIVGELSLIITGNVVIDDYPDVFRLIYNRWPMPYI